ncbi:MAG: FtsQ-type POTRA domain-containing protein [Oscillospiraceae bacterium]|jgi:cell division protein FtsQ|nr:FtsQ-type POTRA domain-containing protein [Oscillospiraceae bacterium]
MAARKNRNRQRRRRGRFGFLYKLLSFLIVFAAVLAGCVVFFRVNQVVVEGNSRYTVQEIIDASGVEVGDNLFLVNRPQTAQNILGALPYVENAIPVHRLPDTVELHITECTPAATLECGGSWWLIDPRGKLLEQLGDNAVNEVWGYPNVIGLHPLEPKAGEWISVEIGEQDKLEGLRQLLTALRDRGLVGGVTGFIDLSASNVIHFGYGESLTVAVPAAGDFDLRAFSLKRVLETFEQRGEVISGTLDLTYGDGEARLLTERWMPE